MMYTGLRLIHVFVIGVLLLFCLTLMQNLYTSSHHPLKPVWDYLSTNLSRSYSSDQRGEECGVDSPFHVIINGKGEKKDSGVEISIGKRWGRAKHLLPPGVTLGQFRKLIQQQGVGEGLKDLEERGWQTCSHQPDLMLPHNDAIYRKIYQHLLYHPNRSLVYCPVWKAMTTSWDAYFLQMSKGEDEDKDEDEPQDRGSYEMAGNVKRAARARFKLPTNNFRARKLLTKARCTVMIVRHPLQRLVSTYRDKMVVRNSTVKDYLYLRTIIKHRYRTKYNNLAATPSFSEFVDFVLDDWSSTDPRPGTWREWSRDWHPAYYLCNPCHLNYTHILRYEHYGSDLQKFRSECGLEDVRLEGTHLHQLGNTSSGQLEQQLYGQLSQDQVVHLAQFYFIDLVMFGYNVTKYLQFARPD